MSVKVESGAKRGLVNSTPNVGIKTEPGRQNSLPGPQAEIQTPFFRGPVAGSDGSFVGSGTADRRQSPFFLPTVGGQPRTDGTVGVIDPASSPQPDRVLPFGDIMVTEVPLIQINAIGTDTEIGSTQPGGKRDTYTDK